MGLAEFLVVFLFVGVNSFDVVGAPDLDLGAVTAHVVGVLAVL